MGISDCKTLEDSARPDWRAETRDTEDDTVWPCIPSSVVKSAGRALQILEFFDDIKRDASVIEVCRALRYPQSSASVLLRSLVQQGYLTYDRRKRTFHPTHRVRVLGSWINEPLFGQCKLLNLVSELNRRTGQTIFLGARNGLGIQYIHVAQATTSLRLHLTPGLLRPLARSVGGQVLLSALPDAEVERLVRRINAERPEEEPLADIREIREILHAIRGNGGVLVSGASKVTPGAAVAAMLLPPGLATPSLVLGVGGARDLMMPQIDTIITCMRETVLHCSQEQ